MGTGSGLVTLKELMIRYGLSASALAVPLKDAPYLKSRSNIELSKQVFSREVISWLDEPVYSPADIAQQLKLPPAYVAKLLTYGGYDIDQGKALPRHVLGLVWQKSAPYRNAPDWIELRDMCEQIGISIADLRRWLRVYADDMPGPVKVTRRSEKGRAGLYREDFRVFLSWLPPVAPPGWTKRAELLRIYGAENASRINSYIATRNLRPRLYREKSDIRQYYPVSAFHRLKLRPNVPPAGGWLTVDGICHQLGVSNQWVETRVNPSLAEFRLSKAGAVRYYYPPHEVERLAALREALPPPAGDWLSIRAIADSIGQSRDWVTPRLNPATAEDRLGATNRVSPHYPPAERDRLQCLIDAAPPADDWLIITHVARALGRSRDWVQRRINHDTAEDRLTPDGRIAPHYPPREIKRLKIWKEGPPPPPAGDWLTIGAMVARLECSWGWVELHVQAEAAEVRVSRSGHARTHYPPAEFDRLHKLRNAQVPAGDWLTVRAIKRQVGRSQRWVERRVDPALAQDRVCAANGRVLPHYPPSEVERLRRISEAEKTALST
jgi:hypothetical protein